MKFKDLKNILFLDIETVAQVDDFKKLTSGLQKHWHKKSIRFSPDRVPLEGKALSDSYFSKAGIFAEFAKIVCITVGYIKTKNKEFEKLRIKSFYGDDEQNLLKEFALLVDNYYFDPNKHFLSGHNIKEFDIPFIARRMIINKIELPKLFNIRGKKPWQVNYLFDTMEMWRFGDFKNYTSLDLLASALNIQSPKDDMDGSQVTKVYYEDDLKRIVRYCEKDVKTTVQVLLRMSGFEMIEEEKIEILSE